MVQKADLKDSPNLTDHIALIKNSQTLYGFVGVPVTGTIYHGGKNKGSFKIINKSKQTSINCSSQNKPIRIIMSKSHINEDTLNYIKTQKLFILLIFLIYVSSKNTPS